MKKYIRALALILALVTVFALPVSAVDMDNDTFFQVLDYSTTQSGTRFLTLNPGSNVARFELPMEAVP